MISATSLKPLINGYHLTRLTRVEAFSSMATTEIGTSKLMGIRKFMMNIKVFVISIQLRQIKVLQVKCSSNPKHVKPYCC